MCGRYFRRSDKQRIAEAFHVSDVDDEVVIAPWDYNVAPTTFQPVIRRDRETGEPKLTVMRWGLIPFFAKEMKSFGVSTINARAESVASSPVFRIPFERRRCLVPADGFYEWKKLGGAGGGKGVPAAREPYAFLQSDGQPMAFAGLWDRWKDPAGGLLDSFTILTTTPNELTMKVHTRMPVILRHEDYATWLSPASGGAAGEEPPLRLLALLRPYPAERMTMQRAHGEVGNVRNNHEGLLNSA